MACSCFEALRRPSLPLVVGSQLHSSLAKCGHDAEDVAEVLCNPRIKKADLAKHVDQLPASLKENILSQLAAFDDDPEVEKTLEALTCSTARAGWTVAFHSPSHTDREAR
ncbi:unnamed protein product [Durusdinium trenchii]|uniref:Uncharacterized protein n=1 Tax=Durusdinium trenchii TaxID=1381693 RepID=A0ABP0RS25_9DINO